ncbi:hypothetical protein TRVA0_017S00496 [Trichomonascus vanleenenianus]|uniref:ubiquitin-protein ligase SAN1 n=1 Tax=Trichomonascus vanleenenianus TaxID=2268995 RepID=UPI003EC9ECEB
MNERDENDSNRQGNNNFSRITITNIALGPDGLWTGGGNENGPPPGAPNWFQMPHAIFLRTVDGGGSGETKHRASKRAIRRLKRIMNEEQLSDKMCSICFEEFENPEKMRGEQPESDSEDPPESVPEAMDIEDDPPESVPGNEACVEDPPESIPVSEEDPSESAPNEEDDEGENGEDTHVPVQMPCGHQFGLSCLKSWLKESNTCPMCRTTIESQSEFLRATGQPQEEHPLVTFMSQFMSRTMSRLNEMTNEAVTREIDRVRRERNMHSTNETTNDDDTNQTSTSWHANANQTGTSGHDDTNQTGTSGHDDGAASAAPLDEDPPESVIEDETGTRPPEPSRGDTPAPNVQYRVFHLPLDESLRTFIAPFLGDENSAVRITFERFATIFRDQSDTTPTTEGNTTNNTTGPQADGINRTDQEAPLQETSGSGSFTTNASTTAATADRSRARNNRDARHHPYASTNSSSDNITSRFSRGELSRQDLQCAMIPMQLCVHSLDEEESPQAGQEHQLIRLGCGHGYHEGCLRWCMRTHGDADIPNLHPQDAMAEVWCTRCRRYRQVL